LTLGEKIENFLKTAALLKSIKVIDDAYFTKVINDDCEYFVRYSNFLRDDGRTRDIVDEVLVA